MNLTTFKKFFFFLILLLLNSYVSKKGKCNYFKNLLPNNKSDFVVMKINVRCEQCLVDLKEISTVQPAMFFFITSKDEPY
jgi:hypothetical protein